MCALLTPSSPHTRAHALPHSLTACLTVWCAGVCMVLTTEDANRTFLSYLGARQELHLTDEIAAAIASSRLLLIEGYLWEMPGAEEAIRQAIAVARACGALVALTAGDAAVVQRHRAELWGAMRQGIDLLFMNRFVLQSIFCVMAACLPFGEE